MKIAQLAPLMESVPPKLYGGTERVVSYLTEELVRRGHEVTLFASGDSVTRAQLLPQCRTGLRLDGRARDTTAHHMLMFERVWQMEGVFDIIHNHLDYLPFSMLRRLATPTVTTLHGRLDIPDLVELYKEYHDIPVVSISDAQRRPLPWAHWQATVYHGLPEHLHQFHPWPGAYLAFMGRISPEKRVDRAIEIARRAGMPLKIAAKIDRVDRGYFEERIKPLLSDPLVEYVGEINGPEKDEFLGKAYALVFPIDWPEPFGLVMIEAMACGTPVLAFKRGSVPEVITDGVNGFAVATVAEAVAVLERMGDIPRRAVRRNFEERFTVERMARGYLDVYEQLLTAGACRYSDGCVRLARAN